MTILKDLPEMITAVEQELAYIRERKIGRSISVYNGMMKANEDNYFRYLFETAEERRLFEDTPITLYTQGKEVAGSVLATEGQYVTLILSENIGETVGEAVVEEDISALYLKIIDRLKYLEEKPKEFSLELTDGLFYGGNFKPTQQESLDFDFLTPPNPAQLSAIQNALSFPVSFIWGPPGTGKTKTLSMIMYALASQGKRVLVVSHANRAVDNALAAFLKIGLEQGMSNADLQQITTRYTMTLLNAVEGIRLREFSFFEQSTAMKQSDKSERAQLKTMMDRKKSLEEARYIFNEKRDLILEAEKIETKIRKAKTTKQALLDEQQKIVDKVTQLDEYVITMVGSFPSEEMIEHELKEIEASIQKLGGVDVIKKMLDREKKVDAGDYLAKKYVVFTTLAKLATDEVFKKLRFDAVIIEEASMAPLPLVALASSIAKSHVVVAGDPQQLPPIAQVETSETKKWLGRDIFMCASGAEVVDDLYRWQDRQDHVTFLDTQYRMPYQLSELVSKHFYRGMILNAKNDTIRDAVVVINTQEFNPICEREQKKSGGSSRLNLVHVEVIMQYVKDLLYSYDVQDIGIISPYRAQVSALKKRFRDLKIFGVEIGTIHTFQGREKRVIIFDTTDAPPERPSIMLDEKKMKGDEVLKILTVAFSRSQEKLTIIAHVPYLKAGMPQRKLTQIVSMYAR